MKKVDCRLIVFAKAPMPGKVKTRLIPFLEAEVAAGLHEQLVLHSLKKAMDAEVGPVELWCTPSTEHPFFFRCAEKFRVELHQQIGTDLGEKMAHAFCETLKRSHYSLLIGTDCPSLACDDLKEAKKILSKDTDAIISPAEDGGYILLGLRQYDRTLFEGVSWGTESVLEESRDRLRKLGWKWHELPKRWDVDRPEDVERLKREGYGHLLPF